MDFVQINSRVPHRATTPFLIFLKFIPAIDNITGRFWQLIESVPLPLGARARAKRKKVETNATKGVSYISELEWEFLMIRREALTPEK